jgi:RNA polymerase sigma factor (sigma-70 family)
MSVGTEELVRAAVAGDVSAQEKLILRYVNVVWQTVRRFRLREVDAQDAVQNTWMSMIEHLHALRSAEALPGWLATTARRECLKIVRQSQRDDLGLTAELAERPDDRAPSPEHGAVDAVMRELLWKHVGQLPARGRELLATLVASNEARYKEYASVAGMPIGSIGPTRKRYLGNLRRSLEEAGLGANAWH